MRAPDPAAYVYNWADETIIAPATQSMSRRCVGEDAAWSEGLIVGGIYGLNVIRADRHAGKQGGSVLRRRRVSGNHRVDPVDHVGLHGIVITSLIVGNTVNLKHAFGRMRTGAHSVAVLTVVGNGTVTLALWEEMDDPDSQLLVVVRSRL